MSALIACPYAASVVEVEGLDLHFNGATVAEAEGLDLHPDGLHRCTKLVPAGGDHLGEHACACGATFVVTASEPAPKPAHAAPAAPAGDAVVYLLWSQTHTAWWRPDARGYTGSLEEAGRFTEADAVRYAVASAQSGIRDKVSFMVAAPDNWQRRPGDVPWHVIELREDSWTIQHPLSCRPDLFACPVNKAALGSSGPPVLGRYEVGLNDAGDELVIGERVEQQTAAQELKTPDEWQRLIPEVRIVDSDGWRGPGGRPWDDPITRSEYLQRRNRCTVTTTDGQRS